MANLARLLIRVFFRSVEVQDAENLPVRGPVVIVINHVNGLVDGLLLLATLSRYPRFLGKSTLFRIIPLWPFLKFAGVIPVHRVSDGASGGNASAFAKCNELLSKKGVVALFPEGISHDESSLQPLKTGAARIALEAGLENGINDVVTVAVGLTYDAKAKFRSRALVRIAQPVSLARWATLYATDSREAVRQFTAAMADQLTSVCPTYESWTQAERLARVAEIAARPSMEALPTEVKLSDLVAVTERLAMTERHGTIDASLGELMTEFADYERDLNLVGLSDAQVAARYPQGQLRWPLVWSLLKVLAATPFAIIGVAVHIVPFQVVKQLAKKPRSEGIKSTVKVLGCTASFALVYAVLGILVAGALGAWFGLLATIVAPLCGYAAVRLAERVKRIGGVIEGYRVVKGRQGVLETVFAHRTGVVNAAYAAIGPS